jgi:hypothetical protein
MELSTLRSHYLLKVNPAEVILANDQDDQCVPSWVFPALLETSFVVVRQAAMTGNRIPVGIRGQERSQRSAAWCPANAIEQIVTPDQPSPKCLEWCFENLTKQSGNEVVRNFPDPVRYISRATDLADVAGKLKVKQAP